MNHSLVVMPGQRELVIGPLDLPAETLVTLVGKPAPEMTGIKGWKNGEPLTLDELGGKIVILNFWGYWCGPCLEEMPQLMALHDAFRERGVVVIGIHNDTVEDIAEMDCKLTSARDRIWWGRDIPFLVLRRRWRRDNYQRNRREGKRGDVGRLRNHKISHKHLD